MDTSTGRIGPRNDLERAAKERAESRGMTGPEAQRYSEQVIRPVDLRNLSPRIRALVEKNGTADITRNSRCPCGSGKRFKRCCMRVE